MRVWFAAGAALAVAVVLPSDALRGIVATAASTLFEATPFVLASGLAARALRTRPYAATYLGCGCGSGPSARSLPAAAAAWLVFGPAIAGARFAAALVTARLLRRDGSRCEHAGGAAPNLLDELGALVPAAILTGIAAQAGTLLDLRHLAPAAQLAGGALLAFAAAPCGLGTIAVAGSLHARAPLAAAGFLCVAGIADARALASVRDRAHGHHDVAAYALAATALTAVACRHGAALVHPAFALALGVCALAAAILAVVHRTRRCAGAAIAPALMLAGALCSAPAPAYRATETTLAGVFSGERLAFTGTLVRDRNAWALVRYAITCCRADAAPVVMRLSRCLGCTPGTWLRADGIVEMRAGAYELIPDRVTEISPPADPFVYR